MFAGRTVRCGRRGGVRRIFAMLVGLTLALGMGACSSGSSGDGGKGKKKPPPGAIVDLDEAEVFLELNATDEDLGIHCFFDGEGWKEMTITDPLGEVIFEVTNSGSLSQLGSTELFTESAEPEFTVLDPAVLLSMFPMGTYRFSGVILAGDTLIGDSDLDHQMPSMPDISTSPLPDDVSASGTLVITWTLDPFLPGGGALVGGAAIEKFEVVVEQEDPLEIEPELVFKVEVPGGASTFTVPGEALQVGMEAKVEVLAIGENGNATAGELEIGEIIP